VSKAKARCLVNRDKLMSASQSEVATSCVTIFDRIQAWGREKQLLALATAFLLMADASGIPAQDIFTASKNLMYDPLTHTGLAPQFQAMRFHLNTDILTKE
jgi:hypothetical protein